MVKKWKWIYEKSDIMNLLMEFESLMYQLAFFYHLQVYYELTSSQFPVDLDSSVGMHCTSITKVMGSNPVQAWIFQVLISELLKFLCITAMSMSSMIFFVGFITLAYSDLKVALSYPQWPCPLQTYIV